MSDLFHLVLSWVLQSYHHHRSQSTQPFIVGLQGPQGIGKSTLVTRLQHALQSDPSSPLVATTSMDDYYLSYHDQQGLASHYPENPLLQYRGNPGTHDVPLALDVCRQVKQGHPAQSIAFPLYNKSLHQGRGDRLPVEQWHRIPSDCPIDILIIEGWCFGFRALSMDTLVQQYSTLVHTRRYSISSLCHLNTLLQQYEPWFDSVNAMIQLKAESLHHVYEWRWQQEVESNKSQLTRHQVNDFVDRFMPAYELYRLTGSHKNIDYYCITLNRERQVIQ